MVRKLVIFIMILGAVVALSVPMGQAKQSVAIRKTVPVIESESLIFLALGVQGSPRGHVRFVISNIGTIPHQFLVIKTDMPAGLLIKPNGRGADTTGIVGGVPHIPPGYSGTLNLTLTRGHYALICNKPGHYAQGQFADYYVR